MRSMRQATCRDVQLRPFEATCGDARPRDQQEICRLKRISSDARRARDDSPAQPAIEADAGQRTSDQEHGVHRDLRLQIDHRDQQQRAETSGNCRKNCLERLARRAARAAMIVGEVPLAAGTGRHRDAEPRERLAHRPDGTVNVAPRKSHRTQHLRRPLRDYKRASQITELVDGFDRARCAIVRVGFPSIAEIRVRRSGRSGAPRSARSAFASFTIEILPDQGESFERFYGAAGDWTALSRRSRSFLGSSFLKDLAHPERYLLVEYWSEMLIYERHLADFGDEMEALAEQRQRFVLRMEALGVFSALDVPDRVGPTWSRRSG
jgi:hypothetical protein